MKRNVLNPTRSTRWATGVKWGILLPLAVGCLSLAIPKPTSAQEQMMRLLSVSGQGLESVETTLTQVQLGVEVQARSAEDAQRQAAQQSSAVVELVRSRNVSKLQTTGIALNPVYNYDGGEQRIIRYSASNTIQFELPTEQAGSILDDAVQAGATRINSVSFIASDEAIAQAQRQALRVATEDAQAQAEAVLSVLGLSSQEVVGIQVNHASAPVPPPMPFQRQMAAEAASFDASTPVVGGEQDVRATVTLQIRY